MCAIGGPLVANSAVVGLLRVVLTANTAEFKTAMQSASAEAAKWTRDLGGMGRQASAIGAGLTKAISVPLLGLGAVAAKSAMDFETAFSGVRKTVDGVVDAGGGLTAFGQQLQTDIRNMAKEMPIAATEISKVAAAAGALGVKSSDITEFTKTMIMLGEASDDLDAEQAAVGMAQFMNVMGTAPDKVRNVANALVKLGNDGASSEGQILQFAQRISGAAATVGMTEGQVLGLSNALAGLGIEAEAGGTAMQKTILDIATAASQGGEKLEQFARVAGMTAEEFQNLAKTNPGEALASFLSGLGRIKAEGGDLIGTLKEMDINEVRLISTLLRAANGHEKVAASIKLGTEAVKDTNAINAEYEQRIQTTAAQLSILWNKVTDVAIELGGALLPVIKSLVSLLQSTLIPALQGAVALFTSLPTPIQGVILGVGVLVAAAGPLIFVLGQLAVSASALTAAFTAKGIATTLLARHTAGLSAAYTVLTTPITLATTKTALLTVAQGTATTVTVTLTGAVRSLWAACLAHPLVAVTSAIGAVTLATVKWIAAAKEKELQEQTQGAVQDVINRAVANGAKATISYADAQVYMGNVVAANAGKWDKSVEAQKRAIEAELALGRITQEQANNQRLAINAEGKVNEVRKNRLSLAESLKVAEAQVRKEIEATGYTMPQLTAALKQNEAGFKQWAETQKLSAATIAAVEAAAKGGDKALAALGKAAKAAATDQKELESAIASLGLVTQTGLTKALADLTEQYAYATEQGGLTADTVKAQMVPALEELLEVAKRSGLNVEGLTLALEQARAARARITAASFDALDWGIPEVIDGLPAQLGQLQAAFEPLTPQAYRLGEAYKFFGVQSRDELQKTAAAAVQHYATLKASGTATPAQIQAAFETMSTAVNAANGTIPNVWRTEIVPGITRTLETLKTAVSGTFAQMMLHAKGFKDGFEDIWKSIKASVLNVFAQILDAFTSRFLTGLIGALKGQQGAMGKAFAGLFGGTAASVGGTAAAAGSAGVYTSTLAGTSIPLMPGTSAAGGGLASGAGTALGGAGAAAGGVGFGMLGKYLTGGSGKGAAAIGAGGGAATGALIGSIVPGLGTVIGAVIGGTVGLITGLLGASKNAKETKEANRAITSAQGQLTAQYGSVENIATRNSAGQALAAGWGSRGVAGAQEFAKLLEAFNTMTARQNVLLAEQKTLQDEITTAEAEHVRLAESLKIPFEEVESIAGKYGITLAQLGPALNQEGMSKQFGDIINDFDTLSRAAQAAGGELDWGGVLSASADEISALVAQSLKFGTEVPENMRPYIEQLEKAGLLVDENGDKLEGVANLKWGDKVETEAEKTESSMREIEAAVGELKAALLEVANELRTMLPSAAATAARGVETAFDQANPTIRVRWDVPDPPDPYTSTGYARGGIVKYRAAGGGLFQPRGTDTVPAMLTPGELVLTAAQQRQILDLVQGRETQAADATTSALAAWAEAARVAQAAQVAGDQTIVVVDGRGSNEDVVTRVMAALPRKTRINETGFRTLMREALGIREATA